MTPSLRLPALTILAAMSLVLTTSAAVAAPGEPWSDSDPEHPDKRHEWGRYGFRANAEYRAQALVIAPLSLTTNSHKNLSIMEHRLRAGGTIDYHDRIRLSTSIDVLDGALWGDNGSLGSDPEPASGTTAGASNVNAARTCWKLSGPNRASADSYSLGLCPASHLFVRRLYADIVTPIGLLRIGRQAAMDGAGTALNDGDGRRNRFGVSGRGNTADRVLFATKPLEAFKPKAERNTGDNDGLFLFLAYDRLVSDEPQELSDDLHGLTLATRYRTERWGGLRNIESRLYYSHRRDESFGGRVHVLGGRLAASAGRFHAGVDLSVIFGETREIADSLRLLSGDPSSPQNIRQVGARAVARYDLPKWTFYLEADYASGDSDPSLKSSLTQFRFSEDTNVGLLLFKHVLAFQSGRAAAAASALLTSLGARSVPMDMIASRGSFTNAFALFPQIDARPIPDLLIRAGVLFAWAPAPVLNPVATLERRGTVPRNEASVNFAGGPPGRYYGTELDLRAQYRLWNHVAFDVEGAILFPGSALRDENGLAVRSGMLQGRTTVYF